MREIKKTTKFKKDFKKIASSGRYRLNDFLDVIDLLIKDATLPFKYHDHDLVGEYLNCRECHIKPDWLLIYRKEENELILIRTGSHSELFNP